MIYKGLKFSIATNVAILLTIGMLLVNIVVVVLWQQHILGVSLDRGRSYLSILINNDLFDCDELQSKSSLAISSYQKSIEGFGADLVFYLNRSLISKEHLNTPEILKILKRSADTQSEEIGSIGNMWSIIGLSVPQVVVSASLASKCGRGNSAGIVINLSNTSKTIIDKQSLVLVYILVNVIILTTIGFFRMTKIVVKPLESLVRLSESFNSRENNLLASLQKKSEIGHVATTLKNMFFKIEEDKIKLNQTISSLEKANIKILNNQRNLIEAEKFAAVGRLSAGLAHEIGNPLGIIQGYIELLGQNDLEDEEKTQYCQRATKELERVDRLISQLLDMSKDEDRGENITFIVPIIKKLAEMLKLQKSAAKVEFTVECDGLKGQVQLNEDDLHQVLLNCLLNSIDSINDIDIDDGKIWILCLSHKDNDKEYIEIVIKDNGSGISGGDIDSVFDPFFTSKEPGHGTGLGLSVSRAIIEKAGGRMKISSDDDRGTTVTITLATV